MTIDLDSLDATAQAALVANGELTSLELVDAALARVAARDPELRAIASLDADRARDAARAIDVGRVDGDRPPFLGVPFLAKDLLEVPGHRCAFGSRLFAAHVPATTSPYVERLARAGLVMLGKTTTSEIGLLGSTEAEVYGVTRNPWDRARSATGSSGGSAAAVAARMVPMAHASDGGGSIRIPAGANGLFGLKPSRGRQVKAGAEDPAGLVVEHAVTHTVRDSARLLAWTEDRDAMEPVGFVAGPDARRLRIGVYTSTLMGEEPAEEVREALERTAALCASLGHDVRPIAPPRSVGPDVSRAFFDLAGAGVLGIASAMEPFLGRAVGKDDFEPFTLALLERARRNGPDAVAAALRTMSSLAAQMQAFLAEVDVTLCPTSPDGPPLLHELAPARDPDALLRRTERLAGYTPIHNVAGVPAMSVPLFTDARGLPLGSLFAASHGREATLLALAYELERAQPWAARRPSLPS